MSVSFPRTWPLVFCASIMLAACSNQTSQRNIPLDQLRAPASSAQVAADPLPPAARSALDKGNLNFRAGKYHEALASYREAATIAPKDVAPYFGVLMVAQKLGNKPLADSASAAITERNGAAQMLSDSTMSALHQGLAAHPAGTGSASTKPNR